MNPSLARWEFRVFGEDFGRAEHRIRSHESLLRRETEEIYILSMRSLNNVKIRDDLLDLKTLGEVHPHHLEQWTPVLKTTFPVTREHCRTVLDALTAGEVRLAESSYSLERFLEGIVRPTPQLHVVHVAKMRETFVIRDCTVEVVDVTFGGHRTRTAAVEHEDPEIAWATVQEVELSHLENINYIVAMKRILNLESLEPQL